MNKTVAATRGRLAPILLSLFPLRVLDLFHITSISRLFSQSTSLIYLPGYIQSKTHYHANFGRVISQVEGIVPQEIC